MDMASVREIKRRRDGLRSTEQITRAMGLIATAKLMKARERREAFQPYFNALYEMVSSVLAFDGEGGSIRGYGEQSIFGDRETSEEEGAAGPVRAVVAFSSNRGLAGGYNHGIVRMIAGDKRFPAKTTVIYAVGNRGREELSAMGYPVRRSYPEAAEAPEFEYAWKLAKKLLADVRAGEIGEIYLAYTAFQSALSQQPALVRVLPPESGREAGWGVPGSSRETGQKEPESDQNRKPAYMEYEPDRDQVMERLIPWYLSGMIYGALLEAAASENGARMTAMESASGNAEKLMEELDLQYNRARQDSITRELTEIAAGNSGTLQEEEG